MSEKEMVSRNVAIALGIICIILIALIAYFTVTGISAQNSYNTLQNQNKQLQTWLDGNETYLGQTQANNTNLQNQLNSDNSMLSSLNSSVTSLRKQVENLQNQANNLHLWGTENSTVLVNNESGIESFISRAWNLGNLAAAGYISVLVSSNNTSTTVGVYYTSNGTDYAYQTVVGFGGIAVFPIMSTSIMTTVIVGNSFNETSTYTATITYYY